jgi:hypothetical protein
MNDKELLRRTNFALIVNGAATVLLAIAVMLLTLFLVNCASAAEVNIEEAGAKPETLIQYVRTFQEFSTNPLPHEFKAIGAVSMTWNNIPYLIVNSGNGIILYDISSPEKPITIDNKELCCNDGCPLTPYGDWDYNLYRFSFCDNCKYALAFFGPAGALVLSLGDGNTPVITTCKVFAWGDGGFTYGNNQSQMGLMRTAQAQASSSLYELDYCSEYYTETMSYNVVDGLFPESQLIRSMYLRDSDSVLHKIAPVPQWPEIWMKNGVFDFAISGDYLITAGPKIELYSTGDVPVKLSGIDMLENIVAYHDPYWVAARRGINFAVHGMRTGDDLERSYSDFWTDANAVHNSYEGSRVYGLTFHPAGEYVYVARYSVLQIYKFAAEIFSDGFESGGAEGWTQ